MEFLERQQEHDIAFHKALWYFQSPELENRAQAKQQEQFAEELDVMIEKIADQLGKLTLISNRDGQVVGSPHQETVGK